MGKKLKLKGRSPLIPSFIWTRYFVCRGQMPMTDAEVQIWKILFIFYFADELKTDKISFQIPWFYLRRWTTSCAWSALQDPQHKCAHFDLHFLRLLLFVSLFICARFVFCQFYNLCQFFMVSHIELMLSSFRLIGILYSDTFFISGNWLQEADWETDGRPNLVDIDLHET